MDLRVNPQFLPISPAITILLNTAHSPDHATYIAAEDNSATRQTRPPKPECIAESGWWREFSQISEILPYHVLPALQVASSGRGSVYGPSVHSLADMTKLHLKVVKNSINFTSTTGETPSNRINDIHGKWSARRKAGISFGINKTGATVSAVTTKSPKPECPFVS